MMGVLSGLEMACWDIIGKAAGKPVYELMGGLVHERLRTYTYLYPAPGDQGEYDYNDADLAAECAARNVEEGFTAVKFDPAGPYTAYRRPPAVAGGAATVARPSVDASARRSATGPTCCSARMAR